MPQTSKGNKQGPRSLPGLSSQGLRLAVVASRFNSEIVDRLMTGALAALEATGTPSGEVRVVRVPGAFELPLAVARLVSEHDAVIALGCVIRGETSHHEHVARAAVDGLERVQLDSGVPIGLGVLTTDTADQAATRAGGKAGNRGYDAAIAAVEMALLLRDI